MKYRLEPSSRVRAQADALPILEALHQVCCPILSFEPTRTLGGAHISRGSAADLRQKTERFRRVCEIPPICTADLESGPSRGISDATHFPDLMGVGANDSEELAYQVGEATALEGRAAGLDWTFSPCVDVAALADSPVVSTRSAARDVDRVIRVCRGYLQGLQAGGMAATLKHFPGDGYTTYDQHLTTPQIPLSMDEWWRGPGRIYRELVDAGAKTVMAGHLGFPAYDDIDPVRGLHPPATLSRRLMVDLLRGEIGFEGLLVSDAMGMGGVAGFLQPYETYARFLENGGDCVLFARTNDRRFVEQMERCLREGTLTERTLRDRAARVIAFKEDLGLIGGRPTAISFDAEKHRGLAARVVDGALALVRDREGLLPLEIRPEMRAAHVVVAADHEQRERAYASITEALSRRCQVEELVDPGPHQLLERIEEFDLVVCSVGAAPSWGVSVARLHGPLCRNLMEGWMRMGTPVAFVSHVHPFVHEEYDPLMDCVVNLFGAVDGVGERLLQGLTGERPFTGKF